MSGKAQTVAPVEAADTSAQEREIDRIVYDLYGLTKEEIAIVTGENEILQIWLTRFLHTCSRCLSS